MSAVVHADAQSVHQLATEPAGQHRESRPGKGQCQSQRFGPLGRIAPQQPAADKQQKHDDVAGPVPQPYRFGAAAARIGTDAADCCAITGEAFCD